MHSDSHRSDSQKTPTRQLLPHTAPDRLATSRLLDPFATKPPTASPLFPFLQPAVEPDELGRLGNYRVLRLLGQGGMGFVFLAEDLTLQRRVALKVMKPNLDNALEAWQRFLREARIMASIKHEHLVTVFQVVEQDNLVYLAMELLKGESLHDRIDRVGPAEVADILRLGREIAAGLAEIHQHNLVRRDIKPSNLWLESPDERVKILDFGLARCLNDDATFTQSGMIVGTPAFMSPEQARGTKVDARSDLFSLGGVLYCLCTGVRPFPTETTMATLLALAEVDPQPVHELNPALPRSLSKLVMRLLAKDPDDRPDSAEAVLEQLHRIEDSLADSVVQSELSSGTRVKSRKGRKTPGSTRTVLPRRRWWKTIATALVLAVLIAFVGIKVLPSLFRPPSSNAASVDAPAQAPEPAKVYLSDLKPIAIVNWMRQPPGPPPDEPGRPPGVFAGVSIAGKPSPHGIFMHGLRREEGEATRLSFRLDRQYRTFQTEVSLNDGPRQSMSPILFSVFGDGQLLWKAHEVWSQADTQPCNIPVKDVEVLTLEIRCPGPARGAHAVWIEPSVSR